MPSPVEPLSSKAELFLRSDRNYRDRCRRHRRRARAYIARANRFLDVVGVLLRVLEEPSPGQGDSEAHALRVRGILEVVELDRGATEICYAEVGEQLAAHRAFSRRVRRALALEAEFDARLVAAQRLCLAARENRCPAAAVEHADHWRDEVAAGRVRAQKRREYLENTLNQTNRSLP